MNSKFVRVEILEGELVGIFGLVDSASPFKKHVFGVDVTAGVCRSYECVY